MLILLCIFIVIYGYKVTLNINHDNKEHLAASVNQNIDGTESLESFDNPERGFYQYYYYNLKENNNDSINPNDLNSNLMHLRIGLGAFSNRYNGSSEKDISQEALNKLDEILKTVKANGGTSIIRFAYDNFDGKENMEPSVDTIIKHINQIGPILSQNKDSISYIELGLFGPWGEMHSSGICTVSNVSLVLDAYLNATPYELTIGVRTPEYYAGWAKVTRSSLNVNAPKEGTKAYRVGIYNDGYLGSQTDLGTYANRSIEVAWLKKQATHTFFGGEVVASSISPAINTSSYLIEEAFKTHTTYLNKDWNKTVIESWRREPYLGDDSTYKDQTGYTYINNHLGYRFVMKKLSLTPNVNHNEKLNINLDIENVGFGNIINSKIVSLVLSNETNTYEFKTDLDPRRWYSDTITNLNFNIQIPSDVNPDEYNIYLRVSKYGNLTNDNHYQTIRFANKNIWDENLKANYLGKVKITEIKQEDVNNKQESNEVTDKNESNENNNKNESNEVSDKNESNKDNQINDSNNQIQENVSEEKNENINIGFILIGIGLILGIILLLKLTKKRI